MDFSVLSVSPEALSLIRELVIQISVEDRKLVLWGRRIAWFSIPALRFSNSMVFCCGLVFVDVGVLSIPWVSGSILSLPFEYFYFSESWASFTAACSVAGYCVVANYCSLRFVHFFVPHLSSHIHSFFIVS